MLGELADSSPIWNPGHLWSRAEILAKPCPVPAEPGLYGWYFKEIPFGVPTLACTTSKGLTLLYVGISPKAPRKDGGQPSRQNLQKRLRYHMRGNAAGSMLRLTVGCLLGLGLRRVGSGERMTFAAEEETLSTWLSENVFATWVVHPRPWEPEAELISKMSLPLNLAGNKGHPFHPTLTRLRAEARRRARDLPILG